MAKNVGGAPEDRRPRVSVDGDDIHRFDSHSRDLETGPDRFAWEAGPMLHPPEPFFLRRGHDFTVHDERGRRIRMEGVQAQYDQRLPLGRSSARPSAPAIRASAMPRWEA